MSEVLWQPCYGPVRTVGRLDRVDGELRHIRDVVTVGNRVKASWQGYGHILGTATVVGLEVDPASGWVKVVVRADRPDSLLSCDAVDPHVARWDWDRTERVPGHWDGETQEQSVGRWLAYLREEGAAA